MSGFQPALAQAWCTEATPMDQNFLQDWLRACWRGAQTEWLRLASVFHKKNKLEQRLLLMSMLRFFRETLLSKGEALQLCSLEGSDKAFMEKFAQPISFESLDLLVQTANTMLQHLTKAAHAKMLFISHTITVANALYEDKLKWQDNQ